MTVSKASVATRWCAWGAAGWLAIAGLLAPALAADLPPDRTSAEEPITPIPQPPAADPAKVALGEILFQDRRLSHDDTRTCAECHDVSFNGARKEPTHNGPPHQLDTLTVFNAALSFRLSWQGTYRTLEAQMRASVMSPRTMRSSPEEVAAKLRLDPEMARQFRLAYGHDPDGASVMDALVTFGRSLVTPGSRFDRWLAGESDALSPAEVDGYHLFKSLGCVSCHQGVNIGGNLFQRHGIFRPLAAAEPAILRVPSLRNVATTPPYFHDGSAPTLEEAVRKMGAAQLNSDLSDEQIASLVTFLRTLTGRYRGHLVGTSQ